MTSLIRKGDDVDTASSDLPDYSGRSSDPDADGSSDPDVVAERLLADEFEQKTRTEIIYDCPQPLVGTTDGQQAGEVDPDWVKAGPAELLSAAGCAPPASDLSASHCPVPGIYGGDLEGSACFGVQFNPKGCPVSVVHWSDHDRLRSSAKEWYGQAVGDGADAVRRDELDP